MKYILALDQGTTSSRAIVFDQAGAVRAVAQKEVAQHFPQPGWVEHDANEIWATQFGVAVEAMTMANLRAGDFAALGITNQRETTVVWNRETGQPLGRAIVWQDRRTAGFCDELKRAGRQELIQRKTGLVIDAYFSASKIRWILDHVPDARRLAAAGKLAFGTIDSWLVWKLTDGREHVTDFTNASRTMLCDLATGEWDDELLELFQAPRSMLPRIVPSSGVCGLAERLGIPIAGLAGDQQAALFGQACTRPGMVKNTYGTGCFMLMSTGEQVTPSKNHLLTTAAWQIGGSPRQYALEGSVFVAGAVVQWLRDGLGVIKSAAEIEALAGSVPDNGGVYLVPAFAGLGAPDWDPYARGLAIGLTRGTTAAHLARAALEAIAFQVADILGAMGADAGIDLKELRVDGGASANDLLMQFQADILDVPVVRPAIQETTALGAAYLAGLAVGYWGGLDEIAGQWKMERRFQPAMKPDGRDRLRARWKEALARSRDWAER
jgi:glycerol kinase